MRACGEIELPPSPRPSLCCPAALEPQLPPPGKAELTSRTAVTLSGTCSTGMRGPTWPTCSNVGSQCSFDAKEHNSAPSLTQNPKDCTSWIGVLLTVLDLEAAMACAWHARVHAGHVGPARAPASDRLSGMTTPNCTTVPRATEGAMDGESRIPMDNNENTSDEKHKHQKPRTPQEAEMTGHNTWAYMLPRNTSLQGNLVVLSLVGFLGKHTYGLQSRHARGLNLHF